MGCPCFGMDQTSIELCKYASLMCISNWFPTIMVQFVVQFVLASCKYPMSCAFQMLPLLNRVIDPATAVHVACRQLPQEPLLLLCLGVSQINLALSKRAHDRNTAVLRGFGALHAYARLRGMDIESCYNLGRAAHQLGLLHIAIAYYERILHLARSSTSSSTSSKGCAGMSPHASAADATTAALAGLNLSHDVSAAHDMAGGLHQTSTSSNTSRQGSANGVDAADLVYEAAHNLSLIYRSSGAEALARQILRTYITV